MNPADPQTPQNPQAGQGTPPSDPNRGYLDDVEDTLDTTFSADDIVSPDELSKRNQQLNAAAGSIDMKRLPAALRQKIGNPLTAQEQTLYAGVADFVTRFAAQLKVLGFDTDHLGQAFDADVALQQCEGSNNQVMAVGHDCVFVIAAGMTSSADAIEQSAADLKADPDTQEAVVRIIDAAFAPVTELRNSVVQKAKQHQTSSKALSTLHTAQLVAAQNRQKVTLTTRQMAKAPLPAASALPGKKHKATSNKKAGRSAGSAGGTTQVPARKARKSKSKPAGPSGAGT